MRDTYRGCTWRCQISAARRLDLGAIGLAPSHEYPTTSRTRLRFVASGCMSQTRGRGTEAPLSCGFDWWQVMGSNHRRLSRRFYRELSATLRMAVYLRERRLENGLAAAQPLLNHEHP